MTTARTSTITGTAALLWTAVLASTAMFGSYAFACVFPFAALATIAALTLDVRRAAALVGAVWLVNQIVGFAFRHYPHTLDTVGWGVAIGVAALAALVAARAVIGSNGNLLSVRALSGLAAAFVAYEGVLFVYALAVGGVETFAPSIVAKIALNDFGWFVALVVLRLAVVRLVPAATAPRLAVGKA